MSLSPILQLRLPHPFPCLLLPGDATTTVLLFLGTDGQEHVQSVETTNALFNLSNQLVNQRRQPVPPEKVYCGTPEIQRMWLQIRSAKPRGPGHQTLDSGHRESLSRQPQSHTHDDPGLGPELERVPEGQSPSEVPLGSQHPTPVIHAQVLAIHQPVAKEGPATHL